VRKELEGWAARHPHFQLQALGFQGPEQMASLYRSASAHVARPGARTATEALFMACPLIFNCYSSVMPQELLAPRYFKSRGLELCIRNPADLVGIVQEWLDKPERYKDLRQLYHQHRLSCDPHELIDAVLG
jgi:UDP-N-acetylglucosamine:LPS N-acetylglucosamine transferase